MAPNADRLVISSCSPALGSHLFTCSWLNPAQLLMAPPLLTWSWPVYLLMAPSCLPSHCSPCMLTCSWLPPVYLVMAPPAHLLMVQPCSPTCSPPCLTAHGSLCSPDNGSPMRTCSWFKSAHLLTPSPLLYLKMAAPAHPFSPANGSRPYSPVQGSPCLPSLLLPLHAHLLMAPPCSACSISSCERSFTNHSKLFWSRFIQKKSTWQGTERTK
jgi:hypothetical protein